MDFNAIKNSAESYKAAMTKFLRELVAIPGESAGEEGHVRRIKAEMEALGFDKAEIDPQGNILGWMGSGKTLIGF
ncbi:MAG: YgeY family selenium metabolism-linked hydrolase, partial [Clostridia bacterium]